MKPIEAEVQKARALLLEGGYTCVLRLGDQIYHSKERGVKPLLAFLNSEICFEGSCAADKTIGAGAAHLYVLLGVCAVWGRVISKSALQVLEENGIAVFYDECVPNIINRQGDGICPIERAVASARSSEEARRIIEKTLQELAKKTG